ncbi:hypothetical protein E9529_13870 [Blastococcus sp. KM273128]|uniref:hypothetical protein n=1 Tax=Blastococcus sp. KM273128 TaxID=2570314 RepID=UPI001F44550B|nr:hypothetical protein [Blastococcus sp. KM273128]MCF6745335.1 hypothetical protein [Blastococcus sp. KM273128]
MTRPAPAEAGTGQEPGSSGPQITPEHARDVLAPRGLTADDAARFGVYSVTTRDELPEEFRWAGEAAVPALVIPWRRLSGEGVVPQLRPDTPLVVEGEERKYLMPKGVGSVIGVVREAPNPNLVIFAEGTFQARVAAAYAPPGASVYALAGCRTWSSDGVPVEDLSVVEGREVVVIFDGDLSRNLAVWTAAEKFGHALALEDAVSVRFAVLPTSGKAGLDDWLGKRSPEKRADYLERLIDDAKGNLPTKPKAKPKEARQITAPNNRPLVEVNGDRHEVITSLLTALKRWDGTRLFSYGGVLVELKPGATVEPVVVGRLHRVIAESATTVATNAKGEAAYADPAGPTVGALLSSADEFTLLDRISRVPFVRPDGSICQTSGYDAATRTFVALDESLDGLQVPEEPTAEDVAAAVKLLTDEWLGDFMPSLPEPADRANLLGLMLTPLVRGLVPLAPLAVVDGLQMGVGKNLVADLLSILTTGRPAQPLPYNRGDDENRKVITSAFRSGAELFVFDEAHVIEGGSFARAITSITYSDRVLGVSAMAEFPNRITWVALGNNVVVNGDVSRRVFRIRLAPKTANPQDRDADSFRHPDIKEWTLENRARLLAAALTLVRAWFAAGGKTNPAGRRFGSFEAWGGIVGGVLDNAGVEGFLGNLVEWRSESDFDRQHWSEHFAWLAETFGTGEGQAFTVAEVVEKLRRSNNPEPPPGMDDPSAMGYGRELGKAYAKKRSQVFDGLVLVKSAVGTQRKLGRWYLENREVSEVSEESPFPTRKGNSASDSADADRRALRGGGSGHPSHSSDTSGRTRKRPKAPCQRCGKGLPGGKDYARCNECRYKPGEDGAM